MAVEPNRWGIIYNPKAGSRKAQKRWSEIRAYLDSLEIEYDYVQSEGFGSVERLSRTLANNGYKTIVVVGGDGAINDAVNGIMHSDIENKGSIAFGVIPNGIGNDFARYWGIDSDDYKAAVNVLKNHRVRKVDVGMFTYYDGDNHIDRFFLNAVYMGLGARIVMITNETKRFWGIPLISYLSSLVLVAFERKLHRMHIKINGEHIRGRIMAVAIGSCTGYGLTPSAVPYNGWLDVSLIYRPEIKELISGLWMLQKGRILNHKIVKPYRTKKVKILRAQNAEVSIDGRIWNSKHYPVDVTILPEALTMIIPD